MQKFIVLYQAPAAAIAEWMKKPEEERRAEEQKMQQEWKEWTAAHAEVKETNAAGANVRVSADGAMPAKNDLMLYSIVEGESPEAVAETFKGHPHLGIPGATIDIMPSRPM